jgi:hypothetical protein
VPDSDGGHTWSAFSLYSASEIRIVHPTRIIAYLPAALTRTHGQSYILGDNQTPAATMTGQVFGNTHSGLPGEAVDGTSCVGFGAWNTREMPAGALFPHTPANLERIPRLSLQA